MPINQVRDSFRIRLTDEAMCCSQDVLKMMRQFVFCKQRMNGCATMGDDMMRRTTCL